MRNIRIKITDNNNPLDELFDKLVVYSAPMRALGKIDLLRARLIIDIGDLGPKATRVLMSALWLGVQWNWNLASADVATGNSVFLKLRVEKPIPK